MVYATAATGSRPPGLITIVQDARQVGPTSDEELVSYELGLKADFFDRHLRSRPAPLLDGPSAQFSEVAVESRRP